MTIVLLTITVALALMVVATIVHVWEAETLLNEELQRLAAERDAFADFTKQVAAIETAESATAVPAAGGPMAAQTSSDTHTQLACIRDAYRETVMAVDHYDEDYGESLADNLAAEFGDGVAVAVADGKQLTPQLQTALVTMSREASQQRASFIATLETEADALEQAARPLNEIDSERAWVADAPLSSRPYDALVDDWHRLGELADRCDEVVTTRQRQLAGLTASLPPGKAALHEYLYDDLPVSYPVLADVASLSEAIEELRHQVCQSISRRG